jgi:hypothetical protein
MNDSTALVAVDPSAIQPPAPPLAPIDPEAAGEPLLPADHPPWQRDVVSLSSRARAVLATVVPTVVRVFSYWDHRLRELAFGARTLAIDPAGCYRLR